MDIVNRQEWKIDLNSFSMRQHSDATLRQEAALELGQNDFLSVDGLPSFFGIPPMRRSLQRQPQAPEFFLLGSVPVYGIRAADVSRKPARYRSVFAFCGHEALPHGYPRWHCTQYAGECQSSARLAHLRRLCPSADRYRTPALYRRRLWCGTPRCRIRAGFHNDRLVSFAVSLGQIPEARWSREDAHVVGSARQHSFRYPYYTRQSSRSISPPSTGIRARRILCHGPRLSGFREALQNPSGFRILRHPCQEPRRIQTSLFHESGQVHWNTQRSDHRLQWLLRSQRLSRQTSPGFLSRRRKQQTSDLLYQQFHIVGLHHRPDLSLPLAGGTLLPMDQTALTHQGVLRNLRKRIENPNLDRDLDLCVGRDREETPEPGRQSLQNSPDFERQRFREKPDFRDSRRCR